MEGYCTTDEELELEQALAAAQQALAAAQQALAAWRDVLANPVNWDSSIVATAPAAIAAYAGIVAVLSK